MRLERGSLMLSTVDAVRFLFVSLDIQQQNLYSAPPIMCPSYCSWMFPLAAFRLA